MGDSVLGLRLPGMMVTPHTVRGGFARQRDNSFTDLQNRVTQRTGTYPPPGARPMSHSGYMSHRSPPRTPHSAHGMGSTQHTMASTISHALPEIDHFATMCTLQRGGRMLHPGLVLPQRLSTTQSLFGDAAQLGTPMALREVSDNVRPGMPRFQTHDSTSMSASVFSNFRKTKLNFIAAPPAFESEHSSRFRRPSRQGLRGGPSKDPRHIATCGSRLEVWGGNALAVHSGSGRIL